MDWLQSLLWDPSSVAHIVFLYAFVVAAGVYLGKIKIYEYKDLEHRYDGRGLKWYFYKDRKKVFCMPYYIEDGNKLERVYKKYQTKNRNKEKESNEERAKNKE